MSLLPWERGLKREHYNAYFVPYRRSPVGAWIETFVPGE